MLSVILGNGELLLEELPAHSLSRDYLVEMMTAGERARKLTQQLLAFSRKQVLQVKVINVNHLVAGMKTMITHLLGENIAIKMHLDETIKCVKADPARLEQVLMNLCINARDAMPHGGVLVPQTGKAVFSEEFLGNHPDARHQDYVMISVSDTGSGMDKEVMQHIFDPFFTTKESGKGTGLGLATVYGIMKQHEGDVSVESELGRGTTFNVYLKTTEEPLSGVEKPSSGNTASSKGETILVVEDEPGVCQLTCSFLRRLGYQVIHAQTASKCIELASQTAHIDLLLTDLIIPEMNGRQIGEHVMKFHPKIKILYMSGYTEDVVGRHGILEEDVHFISKPFTEKLLNQKIRAALDG